MNAADFRFYRQVNSDDNILAVNKEDIETFYMIQDHVKNAEGKLEYMEDFDVLDNKGRKLRLIGYQVEYCEAPAYYNEQGEELKTPQEACYAEFQGVCYNTGSFYKLLPLTNDPYFPFTADDYKEVEFEILDDEIAETEYSDTKGSYELIKAKIDGKETFAILRHTSAYAGDYFEEICEISEATADEIQEQGFESLEMTEYFN